MSVADIISQIDAQILRLHQARSILVDAPAPVKRQSARKTVRIARTARKAAPVKKPVPVQVETKPVEPAKPLPVPTVVKVKRSLSPEGRRRIQEAQRQRWAERNKDVVAPEPVAKPAPPPSALSGAVPAGPVAVSAAEVRKAEARRTQAETAHPAETLASDWLLPKAPELTIDMLFKDLSDKPKTAEEATTNVN